MPITANKRKMKPVNKMVVDDLPAKGCPHGISAEVAINLSPRIQVGIC
jgi:hypothetical protein